MAIAHLVESIFAVSQMSSFLRDMPCVVRLTAGEVDGLVQIPYELSNLVESGRQETLGSFCVGAGRRR
jgi:hypothetical protein